MLGGGCLRRAWASVAACSRMHVCLTQELHGDHQSVSPAPILSSPPGLNGAPPSVAAIRAVKAPWGSALACHVLGAPPLGEPWLLGPSAPVPQTRAPDSLPLSGLSPPPSPAMGKERHVPWSSSDLSPVRIQTHFSSSASSPRRPLSLATWKSRHVIPQHLSLYYSHYPVFAFA